MKKKRKFMMVFLICAMIVTLTACGGDSYSEIDWPDTELGKILPTPDIELKGEITTNSDDLLKITLAKVSSEDFDSYVALCANSGFDLSTYSSGSRYSANNAAGYELSINYSEKEKTMDVSINGSNAYGELTWPDSEIAQLIPIPESNYGSVDWEASYGFVIYVAQTSIESFNKYVDSCKECGFTVDYRAGDDYYYADNEDGYSLDLKYEDGDVMFIRLDEPDNDTTETSETTEPTESQEEELTGSEEANQVSDSDIRPEFKEALDSYEVFFDEYVEFMKKYQDSDDVSSMLTDYTNYMSQYADMMTKLSALEGEDMTTAEAAYYLEVTTRINKNLLEVAQ